MTIYFCSDYHLGHYNIIKYCNRPYNSFSEMNDSIINNHNTIIKPTDLFYFLGDFAIKGNYTYISSLMKRLNGKKHIILGNHDKVSIFEEMLKDNIIDSLNQVLAININKQMIWLSHYPHVSWCRSGHGSWNLHGHCHNSLAPQIKPFRVDVGVDCFNYNPISFDQLLEFKINLEKNMNS